MNPKEYIELLRRNHELLTQHGLHVPICIWGEAGEGKTAIPHQFAKQMTEDLGKPYSCTVVKVGQADGPGDLMGMPTVEHYHACPKCFEDGMPPDLYLLKDLVTHARNEHEMDQATVEQRLPMVKHMDQQRQRFAITDIWPTHGPGILVLDEINRAPQEIQNALLGLVQERVLELTGYRPPDDVIIIATANPATSDYVGVNEVDKAMATRFAHFNLRNHPDAWLAYMDASPTQQEHGGRIALSFFRTQRDLIGCTENVNNPLVKDLKPCPRQAENLVRLSLVLQDRLLMEAAIGTIGPDAALAFGAYLQNGENFLRGEEVVRRYVKHRDTIIKAVAGERHDQVMASIDDLMQHLGDRHESLNDAEQTNVVTFLGDVPKDQAMRFFHEFSRVKDDPARRHFMTLRMNCPEFQQLMLDLGAEAGTEAKRV